MFDTECQHLARGSHFKSLASPPRFVRQQVVVCGGGQISGLGFRNFGVSVSRGFEVRGSGFGVRGAGFGVRV